MGLYSPGGNVNGLSGSVRYKAFVISNARTRLYSMLWAISRSDFVGTSISDYNMYDYNMYVWLFGLSPCLGGCFQSREEGGNDEYRIGQESDGMGWDVNPSSIDSWHC